MRGRYSSNAFARRLFDGIAASYEWPAQVFSLFQYGRWHRSLVSELALSPQALALDVCTGTGLVAMKMAHRSGCQVIGLDISTEMLRRARGHLGSNGLASRVGLVNGRAESLPFPDSAFDIVVFTYLLRYVDDPQAALYELSRVLKPGGQLASLEFFVPQGPVWHSLWLLHTRGLMPLLARFLPGGWREVGAFLGPSISAFYRKYSLANLKQMWARAGIGGVSARTLSLGGAVVMTGRKEGGDES